MEVFYQGVSRVRLVVPVAGSAPGIFADSIVNEDGSLNSAVNPAAQYSIVTLYATGAGQMDPAVAAGGAGPATPLQPVLPVSLTIRRDPRELRCAANAAGGVGRLRVEARAP